MIALLHHFNRGIRHTLSASSIPLFLAQKERDSEMEIYVWSTGPEIITSHGLREIG